MEPSVLLLSSPDDEGIRDVQKKIVASGVPTLLVDTSSPFNSPDFSIRITPQAESVQIVGKDFVFDCSQLRSIWLRSVNCLSFRLAEKHGLTEAESHFLINDYIEFLCGALRVLGTRTFVLNSPDRSMSSARKMWQLQTAATLGFIIPRTLGTKNFGELMRWLASEKIERVAVKTSRIGGYWTLEDGKEVLNRIYTSVFSLEELELERESIGTVSATYQEYIAKKIELRVTVVGDEVFSCAIDNQNSSNPNVREDWRLVDADSEMRCYEYPLPVHIKERCINLVRLCNLHFGCIDFILTPEGEFVFLEINASGEWLWIKRWDAALAEKISAALANLLVNPPPHISP